MLQLWFIGNIEIEEVIQSGSVFYGSFDTVFKVTEDFPFLFSETQIVFTTRRKTVSWHKPSTVYIMSLAICVSVCETISPIFALGFIVFKDTPLIVGSFLAGHDILSFRKI